MSSPKWLNKPVTTRARSKKQESKLAKSLQGRATINSGATFGENDIVTDYAEIEAKTTSFNSYKLDLKDWNKLVQKCEFSKMPVMVIDFEKADESLVVMNFSDFKHLIDKSNAT